jgi:hypothetical protein
VNRPDSEEITEANILNTNNLLDSLLLTDANSEGRSSFHSVNTHFKTKLDTLGKTLNIDLDYFVYDNSMDRLNRTDAFLPDGDLTENPADIFRNTSDQNIKTITSGIDFRWPTRFTDIEFGGKLSFIKNYSNVKAFNFEENDFVLDLNESNEFEYFENIQALYLSASKSLKKWDFKAGLRLEFTQTEGNSITLNQVNNFDYSRLFPTVYVTYNPNENNSWSLNYGKRINRPSYAHLNPFRWYSNPFAYTEGNPFLQPYFIDNFEFSHLYKNNLSTTLYMNIIKDGGDQITLVDSNTNIQATVRKNYLDQITLGLTQSYTFDTVNWFESYFQFDINYSKIKSTIPNTISEQEGFNFYISSDNTFFFNSKKTFVGELNFWYTAPGVDGVDFLAEIYNFDVGLKCFLFKKDLQISLILNDAFRTQRDNIRTVTNNIRQEYSNYYDTRRLRISAKYQFGNRKLKSKRKRFSNEEERSRTD